MKNHIPYVWCDYTFWRNPETGNFESYGFPFTDYTFHIYKLYDLNIWILDINHPERSVFAVSSYPLYHDWSCVELLSLVVVCMRYFFDVRILSNSNGITQSIITEALELSKNPPIWLDSLELENSSDDF